MHKKINNRKRIKKTIAKERITKLLFLAKKSFSSNPVLSKRYCNLIEKLRKSVNLRLSKEQKVQYCKKCYTYWIPGKTVKVRINHANKRVIYECLTCGYKRSFGY